MKQLLLVLSLMIAAFLAACSESNLKTHTKTGGGGGALKTVEEMDQASSTEELQKLKKELESIKNVQIPDIIAVVKRKFGKTNAIGKKDQPKSEDGDDIKILEKKQEEGKITNPPSQIEDVKVLEINSDPSKIAVAGEKTEAETKHVCIQTCEKQIIIIKKSDKDGKVISVSAFVSAEITKDNATITISTKQNKTLKTILATYEASSDLMNLKLEMEKNKKGVVLVTNNFSYDPKSFSSMTFDESETDESGTIKFDYVPGSKIKKLTINFNVEQDQVVIRLNNDSGLFGKNISTSDKNLKAEDVQSPRF